MSKESTFESVVSKLSINQKIFIAELIGTFIVVVLATGSVVINAKLNGILGLPFVRNANEEFSQEAYLQFLAQVNFTDHSFRQFIRDNLISQQMQQAIIGTAFALPMDVKDYVQYLNQRRDFRYTVLGKQNLNQTVAVTDENVKQYYDGHLNQFVTPEKISLDYIHLSLDDIVKNLKYTDQDLAAFYLIIL